MYSDFANLQKGTSIPQWWIEKHVGIKASENIEGYNLARLSLGETIERTIRAEQNIEVFVKYSGRDLRILNDREAAVEGPKRHEQAVRKIRRTLRKSNDIDTSNLDDEQVKRFEHEQRKMQRQADALSKVRRSTKSLLQPI